MIAPPAGFEPIRIPSGFAAEFGPIFARREDTRVWLGFRIDESHCDRDRACHAGALATFADMQLAALQRTGAFPIGRHPTVSLSLDFLRAARPGDWVDCEVELVESERGLVFTQIVARVGTAPIARATAFYAAAGTSKPGAAPPAVIVANADPAPPADHAALDLGPGYGKRFGPVYARMGDEARIGFRVAANHGNVWGACHGGALATFALLQREALRGAGRPISLSIDYLAPARFGDCVECEPRIVKTTRRLLFTQAPLTVAGRPIALAKAIFAPAEVSGS